MSDMRTITCDEVDELASGYVLGALERAEMEAVRAHLRSCDRPHPELVELGGVVPYLGAALDPVEPPASLRGRVRAALADEVDDTIRRTAAPDTRPDQVPSSSRRGGVRFAWTPVRLGLAGLAAAVVLLAGSTLYLARELDQRQSEAAQLAAITRLASAPGSRTVALVGSAQAGTVGLAVLPGSGEPPNGGLLVVDGLAPTVGSQVYEVWVIEGSSPPRPIGGFQVPSSRHGWFIGLPTSSVSKLTVAVTLEKGPGATKPTLPIVASGSAAS